MGPDLTILIFGEHSAGSLSRLLTSLCRQDCPGLAAAPIVVVDPTLPAGERWNRAGHKAIETHETLDAFRDRLDLEAIPLRSSLPATINAYARLATAPHLLFLDADVELPDKSMIRRAMQAIHEQKLELLTAGIDCRHGGFRDDLTYLATNLMQQVSKRLNPLVIGKFMLFQREAFLRLGGFNEHAGANADFLQSRSLAPNRFAVLPGRVLTNNRWLRDGGHGRLTWMFAHTLLLGGNTRYFLRDPLAQPVPLHSASRYTSSERNDAPEVEAA